MWKRIGPTIASAMRRVVAASLGRLYDIREGIVVISSNVWNLRMPDY